MDLVSRTRERGYISEMMERVSVSTRNALSVVFPYPVNPATVSAPGNEDTFEMVNPSKLRGNQSLKGSGVELPSFRNPSVNRAISSN